jgi:RNA polymerase sigma factor (sigma-70 family)
MQQPLADPDWEIVTRMAAGDRDALAELYATHRDPLRRYLRVLIVDPGLAEEVLQDTLYAAWIGAGTFDRRSSVRAWLFGIARRRVHDAVRRRALHVVDLPALETVPAPEPEPESWAIAQADHAHLRAAIARLRPQHREVLELIFAQALPYRATAAILGVPIGTVMSRLHAAKRALRADLARDITS